METLTEDLLRTSLGRLSREVVKTHPEFSGVLVKYMTSTCGLIPDRERAGYYRELGTLLMDLGRLYLAESDVLDPTSEVIADGDPA